MTALSPVTWERAEWQRAEHEHVEAIDTATAPRRARASRGQTHPVDDFVYTYYSYKPSLIRRWHPGVGVRLAGASESQRETWRWYVRDGEALAVDHVAFAAEKAALLRAVAGILGVTAQRKPSYGCFGLHEWAMVYHDDSPRHDVPLRLGTTGTNDVVEAHELRCTHFDAFRFFTPDAVPRNAGILSADQREMNEQPGCLHANMDLYKWAVKLGPLVPGAVLRDTFFLARDIREVDMRASPYDLSSWGYAGIAVETPQGKSTYGTYQRAFAARAEPLRAMLLAIARGALSTVS